MVVVARPPRPRLAYSLIRASAVGSTPPRPSPARNRSTPNTSGLGANAHSRVNTEKLITVHSIALRRPMRSLMVPAARAPIITPTSPMTEITAAEFGFRPQSSYFSNVGSTTPSTTRSKPSRATAIQHSGATQPAYLARGFTTSEPFIDNTFRGSGRWVEFVSAPSTEHRDVARRRPQPGGAAQHDG